MKALFITTPTNDVDKLVGAWDCWNETPADRWVFNDRDHQPTRFDVTRAKPYDVIFYVGAARGTGLPDTETLRQLNSFTPMIHICCDGGDEPWWPMLHRYTQDDCFTKQVTIDGHQSAPVDLVTLTPVDLRPFSESSPAWASREHYLLFPGNLGSDHRRRLVGGLGDRVTIRERDTQGDYSKFAGALENTRLVVNSSLSGTAETHHVKGRVLEAAFAGCGLFEMVESPTPDWIPEELFRRFHSPDHLLEQLDEAALDETRAQSLRAYMLQRYHPQIVYFDMLKGVI